MRNARKESKRAGLALQLERNLTMGTDDTYEARVSLLRSVPLFHHLPERELQKSARLLEMVQLTKGIEILNQGNPVHEEDSFYILVQGEATVYIRAAASRRGGLGVRVARLTPGDIFGHEALISGSTARGATVVVGSTTATCYVGDRQLLVDVVASISAADQRLIFNHFSDLRSNDTASLATYAHQIRKVIRDVGAEVLAFELEQERLIRATQTGQASGGLAISHARTTSTCMDNTIATVNDDWSLLLCSGDVKVADEMGKETGSSVKNRDVVSSSSSSSSSLVIPADSNASSFVAKHVFSQGHVELLREMTQKKGKEEQRQCDVHLLICVFFQYCVPTVLNDIIIVKSDY